MYTIYRARISASNFQVLICNLQCFSRYTYPFFGWLSSYNVIMPDEGRTQTVLVSSKAPIQRRAHGRTAVVLYVYRTAYKVCIADVGSIVQILHYTPPAQTVSAPPSTEPDTSSRTAGKHQYTTSSICSTHSMLHSSNLLHYCTLLYCTDIVSSRILT